MQFVAPAQFFLVLWLMAATAPAATALMNGSLIAITDVRSKDLLLLPASDDQRDDATEGDAFTFIDATHGTDVTTLICLALSEGERSTPFSVAEGHISFGSGEKPVALSLSLLHTTVQRHRPRIA
jgi:hypothetical protein